MARVVATESYDEDVEFSEALDEGEFGPVFGCQQAQERRRAVIRYELFSFEC